MGFADELVVPGSGPVGQVLLSVAQLCAGMNENQAACERLLRRLTHIFDELKTMEERCQLPASGALGKYAAVVAKFLDYLKRYRGKRLAFRIIKHQQMQDELREIHDGMDVVFAELNLAKGTDWKQQSEGDQRTQHKLLKSMAQNSFAVKRELQQTRTQLEAMLTLQFEASQVGRHSKEALELIRSMMGTIVRASKTTVEKLPPWYLPPEEIQVEPTPLAQGSFASAHYGTWGSGTSVVVKRFHVEDIAADERVRQQVVAEISMWYQCNHPNVCKLFGGSHVSAPPFLVCENATNSDMASFLARSEANKQQMWRLLYEAALGLDYLHRQGVIHGELKLRNILVGADGQAKLSDFGLSAIRSISTTGATAAALRWRAPESPKKLTFASDVFALGMCCIEAVTGQPPFADLDDESARYKLIQGVIPDKPADMPTEVWELVESTVKSNPEERLELQEVLKRLKAFADIAVVQEPTVQIFASRAKETLTDSKGTMLRDLAVSGSGAAVVQVLDSIAKLCLEMKEGQATYQRLHQRLQSIFDELEKKDRLPSPDTLKMYVDVVAKTLLYLERHRKKNIVARLILHQSMMEKVREINEDIDMVFKSFSLAEVDAMMTWKQQWEADQRAQDEQMKAMVSNTADVMSELQSSRSQLEALMMLKFETEHRGVRQNDKAMELLQSMMTTVAQQSKVTMSDELPPWFIPSDEIEFEREPFAMGAFASVHHGVCKNYVTSWSSAF